MLKTESLIRVRYAETDQMGFVYHSNYLIWMEAARIEMLDHWGMPYRQMEADGFLLPVLEAHVQYHRPARFDDRIVVEVEIREKPIIRWKIHYRIYRQGENVNLVTGFTQHAFIDSSGRPVKPPEYFREKIRQFFPN